jgi:hypothetical protein
MTDLRFPVLSGRTIPGRAPRMARWLRAIAERVDGWADRLDDRYESPLPVSAYEDVPTTVTWGSRYLTPAEIEQIVPEHTVVFRRDE